MKEKIIGPVIQRIGRRIERNHFSGVPILIVACPRSGTTLLLSILSAVPTIFAMPKQTYGFDKWKLKENKWIPYRLDKFYREFLHRKIPKTAVRWLEKTPGHIRSMDKILAHFDNRVKIIHIIRDGRDVTVSAHPAYTDRRVYWVDADRWVREVRFGLQFKDHPCVHTLKYEDLILHYEAEVRKIMNFIGEPFNDNLHQWKKHTQIKKSIHWGGDVKDLHSKSIGKWMQPKFEERVKEFMENEEAVKLSKELGYL